MKILVVIPCLNEEQHLERLVHQALEMCKGQDLRIVIADGGSRDRTRDIARALGAQQSAVTYLANPKRLQSAALNLAVATYGAEAEFLLRLDAHSEYPAEYCRTLLAEVEAASAAAIVVRVDTIGMTGFQRAVAAAQNSKLGNGGSSHRTASGEGPSNGMWVEHGHHALMRLDAFRAVGGYDESFSHNEDAELDFRLGRAGYKIWLTGKTVSRYYPRGTPLLLLRQYRNYGRGRMRTILKHHIKPRLRQLIPALVLPAGVAALAAPFFWPAALPLLCWALLCLGYGAVLGLHARSFWVALAGPAAMIMHAGFALGFWQQLVVRARR